MAAPFEIPSLEETHELAVASFRNHLPDKNVGRNSDNWKRLKVTSSQVQDNHFHLQSVGNEMSPLTCGEAKLEEFGQVYGVPRKGATSASGADAGRIRGTAASTWAITDILVHTSGLQFRPTIGGAIPGGAVEALVGIVAIDTGPETRLAAGEILRWVSTPPAGLEAEVELVADLDVGGEAKEELGTYRNRVLNRIAQPAQGGNANDWRQWTVESADYIATAYIYPHRNGLGSVDVAALKAGSGAVRLLDAGQRVALLAVLDALRPVGAAARVLEVITQTQNVEIVLIPLSGAQNAKDWDDGAPLVVSTWTAGTRTLVFTTARPASMLIGKRLIVSPGPGAELEIESLVSTNGVVVKDALGQTPAGGNLVYSGGPIVKPARDAVLALFDALGPRLGLYGLGDWESSLLLGDLSEAAQSPAGVRDIVHVTPTANVEPTAESFPDDTQVRLLIPGNVILRYQ